MTNGIAQMVEAAHGSTPAMMEVFLRYDYQGDGILLVVEGKDDSIFYERVAQDRSMVPNRRFETIVAGEKDAVMAIYEKVDWGRFEKNRLLFFVDRDYTDFVEGLPRITGDNIYITDGYSIENSLLNQHTAIALAGKMCTSNVLLSSEDKNLIIQRYEESKREAARILIPIAACQILCLQQDCRFDSREFNPERYLVAEEGRVLPRGKAHGNTNSAVDAFLETVPDATIEKAGIDETVSRINEIGCYECTVRGKYRLKVFRIWLQSLKDVVLPSGAIIKPGATLNDLLTSAMAAAAAPQSLKEFFDRVIN